MKTKFPFDHVVDCIQKNVLVNCSGEGQIGRYGVSHFVNKFYPGYTFNIVGKEYLNKLRNQQVQS